jgi:hypothetical protein
MEEKHKNLVDSILSPYLCTDKKCDKAQFLSIAMIIEYAKLIRAINSQSPLQGEIEERGQAMRNT